MYFKNHQAIASHHVWYNDCFHVFSLFCACALGARHPLVYREARDAARARLLRLPLRLLPRRAGEPAHAQGRQREAQSKRGVSINILFLWESTYFN